MAALRETLLRVRASMGRALCTAIAIGASTMSTQADPQSSEALARQRAAMVGEVVEMARDTGRETGRPTFAPRVLDALQRVERHRFVPDALVREAYANRPLPIGNGQTISQPYIVALSTDLLDLEPGHRVLEVGTGSGYQAAVLAALVDKVYSIEIVESLGRDAAARLAALGFANVEVRIGDGYRGWPEHAPYDRVLVTAAAPYVPDPLLEQLKAGGRMVIPVGAGPFGQQLLVIDKDAEGRTRQRNVLPVRFVPLTGPGVDTKRPAHR
jgi:protein-L-isoaspartate(D-aspartate) O-methyltransferase